MPELAESSVLLIVTSLPYPMIHLWDRLFAQTDPKIAELWQQLEVDHHEETVRRIYSVMHHYLAIIWQETFRDLCDRGIACINIGDETVA